MSDLHGRIAVVTGASAGIGRAIALELAGRGARVVVNARREGRLRELAEQIGEERARAVAGDASEASTIDAVLEGARDRWGREADLVVVNAGRGLAGSVTDSDESQWEEMVRTNLTGAAMLMRRAARRMVASVESDDRPWTERARDIVVLGSIAGKHISPFSSMYGSTKWAVNSLAEAMRRELGPQGIRVTLIAPAVVRSEFQQVAGYDDDHFGQFMEGIGPVLEPEHIAKLIGFVVSQPAAVHVNDVVIRPTRQEYP